MQGACVVSTWSPPQVTLNYVACCRASVAVVIRGRRKTEGGAVSLKAAPEPVLPSLIYLPADQMKRPLTCSPPEESVAAPGGGLIRAHNVA